VTEAAKAEDGLLTGLKSELPLAFESLDLAAAGAVGLVIVDEVVGFASPGGGNLAPPGEDAEVARMVFETDRLAKRFVADGRPILAFLDSHEPGKPEPPYPPHCERGSGEDELVPELRWLEAAPEATLIRKDCINGFVGAISGGRNLLVEWATNERLNSLLVVGICTDICVMDLVLTLLSARNHGLMPGLVDIFVYNSACATYDLPRKQAENIGLSPYLAHPRAATHHMGLYFMASRGACLVDKIS
jgi:nicotinamidase-related amidase